MSYKIKYINLAAQHNSISKELKKEIDKVFKNSAFILRKNVLKFEQKICKILKVKYCVSVNSGTDALLFALSQAGLKKNDEVITPSHTYVASVSAINHVGAIPIFVDIDDDFNIDPDLIEKKITKKTKAIMVIHLNGRSCEMKSIIKIAKKHKLKIIEDAAQGFGAKYNGKFVGNFGLAAAFSLHPMKNLSVPGDGGFLTTNNKKIYKKVLLLRDHGRIKFGNKEIRKCYGFNSRLDNLHASVALIKLKYFFRWMSKRRKIAEFYNKEFKSISEHVLAPKLDKTNKSHQDTFNSYVIRTKKRDGLKKHLIKNKIEVFSHIDKGVHLEKNLYSKKIHLPKTEQIEKEILSLPIYPELTKKQQIIICNAVKKFYTK
jgi:dTDP-4-amino-4,6-dideoxygalactose transaminase|tara:strand:- start:751 stop:1872 length:1122 start_codon:yes stop_codon:yes gene_type:complete